MRPAKEPMVTLQTRGTALMNKAAFEMLGKPAGVELFWSKEHRVMGMRPAHPQAPDAYPVRKPTKADAALVSIQKFRVVYGLDRSVSRRYRPKLVEGTMYIDIEEPIEEAVSPRRRDGTAAR